ncbi:hypothetical protein [Microcoleus sp. herbarium12]|uniref:hypothetical protein n=1 Tax=Microcoleus sp. herbarium12 TaxID=3055437 RepID=UPI002FCFC442
MVNFWDSEKYRKTHELDLMPKLEIFEFLYAVNPKNFQAWSARVDRSESKLS